MTKSNLKLTFNLACLALGLGLGLALCRVPFQAPALWRHLAEARVLASQGGFPARDPFVFGAPGGLAFDRSGWLYGLLALWLHQAAGLAGLAWARALLLLAAFGLCLGTGFRRGSRPFSTLAFSLAALAACGPLLQGPRQALELALFSLMLLMMEGDFWPSLFGRWVWLPLLAVAWINTGPTALLLPPLLLLWLASEPGSAQDDEGRPALPGAAKAVFFLALSAGLLLNPQGWKAMLPAAPWPGLSLSPLAPGRFDAAQPALCLMAFQLPLLLAAGWVGGPARRRFARDLLLFGLLGLAGLVSSGLLPFFFVWAAPVAAGRLDQLVDSLPAWTTPARWAAKLGLLLAALWWLPRAWAGSGFGLDQWRAGFPRETLDFIRNQGLADPLMAEAGWGGWISWRLEGQAPVLVDDRMAPPQAARDYRDIQRAAPDWDEVLKRDGARAALLKVGSPLARAMAIAPDWQPVCFDDVSVLYVEAGPEHASLINTYAPRGLRPGDPAEPFSQGRMLQCQADLEVRLSRYPAMGRMYLYQSYLLQAEGRLDQAEQALRTGIDRDPLFEPCRQRLEQLKSLPPSPAPAGQ